MSPPALAPCPACRRHVRTDGPCPFCEPARPLRSGGRLGFVGGVISTLVLAACYGTGGFSSVGDDTDVYIDPGPDADGDGYPERFDCDDSDADVNPDALEICDDGIDNDCDDLVDLDDGDCFGDDTDTDTDTDG